MSKTSPMAKVEFGQHKRPKRKTSWLEDRIAKFIEQEGLPAPAREFRFAPPRLFRFDFCWPDRGVALEAEGGIWTFGRHSRGAGLADDADKYNLAAIHGWRVFRVTERQVRDGSAFPLIRQFLTTEIRYVPSVLTEVR